MNPSFKLSVLFGLGVLSSSANAQFVFPKPGDHEHDPGLYTEDPFIVEYRKRFFAVFKGDVKTFQKAYAEIAQMVVAHPHDARARVWLGNGETVEGALNLMRGQKAKSLELLKTSRLNLRMAVAERPADPNIYMMQAATLYIQGQYWPAKDLPSEVWETLRDDCLKFMAFLGPDRLAHVSTHVRGETLGELGIAYKNLGQDENAVRAFRRVCELCPGTDYETRAKKEIAALSQSAVVAAPPH